MNARPRDRSQPAASPPPPEEPGLSRAAIIAAVAGGLVLLVLIMVYGLAPRGGGPAPASVAALDRPYAPSIGDPAAKVHIVEFMDPACETCREFYPLVKQLLSNNPGRVRLSIRLVAFHPNADVAVRALEAAKLQGKYWVVLERLLATQPQWVVQHRVDPDALQRVLATLDVDLPKLRNDMDSPAVAANIAQDLQDAKAMKVTATPEYFVNGRGLPQFGFEQLQDLVREEVSRAYR